MWGALQEAARTITLLLDKSGEGHRKCPRCRGSGLLGNALARPEKKGVHPNHPCWFCEGVGALPVAGLNGFVLARATPCLKGPDKHYQPCVDILQLNHSRYCKERCKFTYAKLGANLADLLFDLNMSPWVNCSSLGRHQQNALDKSEANQSVVQPCVSEPRLQPLSSFSQKDPWLSNGFFQRILNTPLVLSVVNNSQPTFRVSPTRSAVLVPVNQKIANICLALELKGAFAMRHASYMQKPLCCNVSSMTEHLHLEPKLSGHFLTRLESETAATGVNFKRQNVRRKARNCVRDKAVKEAQERSQGFLRSLKGKAEPDLADSHVQPERMEATSRSLQGAHGERSLPFDMPSRVVWLTTVAVVARQVFLNRLIADGFKEPMPALAKSNS